MKLYSEKIKIKIEDFAFNNMLINPSLTSIDGTNPGFSLFNYDASKQSIHSLKMLYLEIRKTYGMQAVEDINDPAYVFEVVNFEEDYGVRRISPTNLLKLTKSLEEGGMEMQL